MYADFFFNPSKGQSDAFKVLPSLEERHVKDGRVGVHELQQEGFQDEALLKVGFSFGNFWMKKRERTKTRNIKKAEFR